MPLDPEARINPTESMDDAISECSPGKRRSRADAAWEAELSRMVMSGSKITAAFLLGDLLCGTPNKPMGKATEAR